MVKTAIRVAGVLVIAGTLSWAGYNAVRSIEAQNNAWIERRDKQLAAIEQVFEDELEYHDYAPYQECDTDTDCMNKFGGDGGY